MGGVGRPTPTGCDVLVIGAGVAGVSAAARLAGRGRVIVLEREDQPGRHATGRSAAMFIAGYGDATVRALSARAAPVFAEPDPEVWGGPLLTPRGELLIARPGEEDGIDAQVALGCEALSPGEAVARVPILDPGAMVGAAFDADAADIDVDLLMQGYLRLLRRRGGRVVTGADVTRLAFERGRWTATTQLGAFSAPVVVNAAGAWADLVAGLAGVAPMGLRPLRRSAAILPAPAGHDVARWPMVGGIAEDWYAKPTGGKLLVSPADEDHVPPQDAWADDLVLAEGLARFEAMTTVAVTRVERSWAGLRSFLPDRTPVAGFEPGVEGFFWLAGQGGYGIQTAPALAELTDALVMGERPALQPEHVAALSCAGRRTD